MKRLVALIGISFITEFAVETCLISYLHPPFMWYRKKFLNKKFIILIEE
jgi:hypothetical protein